MKFDRVLLEDYIATREGARVLEFFRTFKKAYRRRFHDDRFFDFVGSLLTIDTARSAFHDGSEQWIKTERRPCETFDDFERAYRQDFEDEQEARDFQGYIPKYSADLFCLCPEFAFPYLFPRDFHKIRIVCALLDIPFPHVPGKTRRADRFNFYFSLSRAFYEFRIEHGLSPVELCVAVYGFAARFIKVSIDQSYGEANRVYIVGATRYDVEEGELKRPTKKSVAAWQGSEDMLPGDIVLVYETAPFSRIRSIWRAVTPGFDDPFTYYPGSVYLGHPVVVPSVGIDKLRADPVWSKKGLVRASMVGVNGKTCTVEEYEALKKMFKRADPGFDLAKIPNPPPYARFYHDELKVERDVERCLLEPLLRKIGFSKWVRQLPLRMGRGDRVFPDYALRVRGRGDDAAADFIWEAKYRIPTSRQLRIDFGQAKSYALRLQSKALGLVAIEGVWFTTAKGGFKFDSLLHYSWDQLRSPDSLATLKRAFS